jgi:hypothetical protein
MSTAQPSQRRTRREDSLAAAVLEIVEAIQHPVPTTAVRLMLVNLGRDTSAERLGTLAAYERQDHARTRMPPRLCPAIDQGAKALMPRWWTAGTWRLERRIITPDAVPGALAALAVHLCRYHADRAQPANPELVSYTVGLANQVVDLPRSPRPPAS